ncbi:MAG: hypothetical protein MZV65_17155 [Chromatiales bacterium]|nr:hypothetical protein [Chromatiales bacterium]
MDVQPLRAEPAYGRVQRRHGGGGGGRPGAGGARGATPATPSGGRRRYQRAGRHPLHHGAHQPRRGHAATATPADVGGPAMARTVEDAVRVFDARRGTDLADPVTSQADEHRAPSYLAALRTDVGGLRAGVPCRMVYTRPPTPRCSRASRPPWPICAGSASPWWTTSPSPEYDSLENKFGCSRFRFDIENYLPRPPRRCARRRRSSRAGRCTPTVMPRVKSFLEFEGTPETNPGCVEATKNEELLRQAVRRAFAAAGVQALIYFARGTTRPARWATSPPPREQQPDPVAPHRVPALTVPMGFVRDGALPVGLQIFGDASSEPTLIRLGMRSSRQRTTAGPGHGAGAATLMSRVVRRPCASGDGYRS